MSKIYHEDTIKAVQQAQKGNLQEAADLMTKSSGIKTRCREELSHHYMNWFNKKSTEQFDEVFMEDMFSQHMGLILHLQSNLST